MLKAFIVGAADTALAHKHLGSVSLLSTFRTERHLAVEEFLDYVALLD